jgi:hypothetical protein
MSKLISDKGITDYDTLVSEQKRLKELLKIQKRIIQEDIQQLRYELNPAVKALSTLSKLTTSEKHTASPALQMGANATIDWALKRLLSSRPVLKFLLPIIVKNYSSHYLHKAVPFIQKIKEKIFGKRVKPRAIQG